MGRGGGKLEYRGGKGGGSNTHTELLRGGGGVVVIYTCTGTGLQRRRGEGGCT